MVIYIFVFTISTLFLYVEERVPKKNLRRICIVLSILLPSLLAALRADSIGRDTTIYGISYYQRAVASKSFLRYIYTQIYYSAMDMGYNTVTYICSLISSDYHFGFFVYQLLTLIFIYAGAFRFKKNFGTPVHLTLLLYYFCLYNYSLNAMRQIIAVSIVFFAASFLFEHKFKWFLILNLIAITFHTSAILGLALIPLYMLTRQGTEVNELKQVFRGFMLLIGLAVIMFLGSRIVTLLVNIGFFRANYLNYLSGGKYSNGGNGDNVSLFVGAFQLVYIAILLFNHRRLGRQKREPLFFLFASVIVFLTTFLGPIVADYISRLSYYFIPLQMVGLVNTSYCFSEKKNSRVVWLTGIFVLVFLYWLRSVVIFNYAVTVPYEFFWN